MTTNFGNVSHDYAKYRDHLPYVIFEQLNEKGIDFKGVDVVDLGLGTGIFSRDLFKQGANVTGIEYSNELIKKAAAIDRLEDIKSIHYIEATAEDFTLSRSYPIFTVVRAWHWFERDKVIQNIKKYLASEGLLIVVNSIFLPNSEVAKITFEVLVDNGIELKPAGSNAEVKERRNGFPANWFKEWEDNSFQIAEEWQHDYLLQFTHEEWCGKIRSVSWLTNSSEEIRSKITNELMRKLSKHEEFLNIPHRFSIVVLKHLT